MGVVQHRSLAICVLYLSIAVWQAEIPGARGECGGYFNESEVVVTSPNHPEPFPDNTTCEYFIEAPFGYRVLLTFIPEIPYGVPLRIGYAGSDSYLYALNSIYFYHNRNFINSQTNEMYMIFESEINISNNTGFSVNITFFEECSVQYFYSAGSNFSTPNYPIGFYNDIVCDYFVEAPPGMVIRYKFLDFDLGDKSCAGDRVLIYDRENRRSFISEVICSEYAGTLSPTEDFITYGNFLKLGFVSTIVRSGRGFLVSIIAFEEPRTTYINNGTTTTSSTITSDGYPGGSPRSFLHRFIIEAPVGVRVKITFDSVDLGSYQENTFGCDTIRIFETNSLYNVNPGLAIECSDDKGHPANQYQVSEKNKALLLYRTYSGNEDGYFVANITYFTDGDLCPSLVTSDGSILTSPFYPEPYPDLSECTTTIVAPTGFIIQLSFQALSMEYFSNCRFDGVSVYDGRGEDREYLQSFCGSLLPPPLFSSGNVMSVQFYSDYSIVSGGYRATVSFQEIQANVLVYPAAISLAKYEDLKMIQNFPSGYLSSFYRGSSTGTGANVPRSTDIERSENSLTITIPRKKKKRQERIGVFNHEMNSPSGRSSITVATVVQWRGQLSFSKATMTTYRGEDIRLSVKKPNQRFLRWRRKGKTVPKWNGRRSVKIEDIQEWQAGVYECYRKKYRKLGQHAILRVIVQACPRNRGGKPACNMFPTNDCLNGGVPNQEAGSCLCAPGFGGKSCEQMYGPGVYGYSGEYHCSNNDCKGSLICQKDPYGCSCATGYQGSRCEQDCQEGTYGANCEGICHCTEDATCDPMTGICSNGICASEWDGPNCQEQKMMIPVPVA